MWRVEHFEEIDSTNAWVIAQARAGAGEGLVAHADYQSAGRGRLDRRWEASAGTALLCSLLLRPKLEVEELQLCVAAVALSARSALAALGGVRPGLKWPNDLIIDDAKVAGLLAEVVTTDAGVAVVVGIGVNLTERPAAGTATSVLEASGVTLHSRVLLDHLLEEMVWRRPLLDDASGRQQLADEYAANLVTLGQPVRVERRDDVLHGVAQRVDDSGQLIVRVASGDVTVMAGDVIHLRSAGSGIS